MRISFSLLPALALAALLPAGQALADAASNISTGASSSMDGHVLYQQICQGCHMPNARGATGAATIPALAGNPKLRSSGYPVYVVLNGLGGMPWVGADLSDAQVASVVNYVRSHFGNSYTDMLKPDEVAAIRGPVPTPEK